MVILHVAGILLIAYALHEARAGWRGERRDINRAEFLPSWRRSRDL